jgi:hypothetical protein
MASSFIQRHPKRYLNKNITKKQNVTKMEVGDLYSAVKIL